MANGMEWVDADKDGEDLNKQKSVKFNGLRSMGRNTHKENAGKRDFRKVRKELEKTTQE